MLHYFGEQPTTAQLLAGGDGTMAWYPHLAYFSELARFKHRDRIAPHWTITRDQIKAWLDDWAIATHVRFAHSLYGDIYLGESFDMWVARLAGLLIKHGAASLESTGLTPAWTWKAYLAGYQAPHAAYVWACDQNALLRRRLNPDDPVRISTVWAHFPEPDDHPF